MFGGSCGSRITRMSRVSPLGTVRRRCGRSTFAALRRVGRTTGDPRGLRPLDQAMGGTGQSGARSRLSRSLSCLGGGNLPRDGGTQRGVGRTKRGTRGTVR